jgi:hypothetical protein
MFWFRLKKRAAAMNQETHRLLDSAKKVNANPGDLSSQKQLLNACLRLENLAHELLADAGETASLVRLRYCSKTAAAGTPSPSLIYHNFMLHSFCCTY